MDDLMASALHSMIHKQFETWKAQEETAGMIKNGLLQDCEVEDSNDKIYVRMIFNAMEIAADLSAKIILEMLLTAEVIKPQDEEQLRKIMLSVVK